MTGFSIPTPMRIISSTRSGNTLMAEDAVESAGAKAPAITISIQPFIAGLEVLCHQTIDVGHSVEFYRMAILYASYFLIPTRAVSLGWGRFRTMVMCSVLCSIL